MQRVMIVGQPGAGKSTLARQIGRITGLPVVHIDLIHWQSGWVERTREEKTRLCHEVHAQPAWIFEGGHSVTWAERLERCDTLIWLDVSLARRIKRVVLRTLRHLGRTRPDLPEGCPERFDPAFFRWIWDTRRSGRAQIARLVAGAPPHKQVVHLTGNRAVTAYLDTLQAKAAGGG